MLALRDIVYRYRDLAAVDGASLTIETGELVVLFGPSGCGKTTLLRIAAGLERPQTGRVSVDGAELSGPNVFTPPEKRPMGFVFQDYVLFPHLSAAENVAFGLTALPKAERRSQALAELAAAGLSGMEDRRPHELSGGQQQRVALARAMARRPKAMLLDEPFAGIDADLRRRLRADVRAILKANGAATILVTHDAEEALALADRIAVMKAGRIIETATPPDLFERPQTIEGAMLFPGAQAFSGECRQGRVATPFGEFAANGAADGPVICIAQHGAVSLASAQAGRLKVRDARFAGPGWRLEVGPADAGPSVIGHSPTFLPTGLVVEARFDPARLRLFPARSPN